MKKWIKILIGIGIIIFIGIFWVLFRMGYFFRGAY